MFEPDDPADDDPNRVDILRWRSLDRGAWGKWHIAADDAVSRTLCGRCLPGGFHVEQESISDYAAIIAYDNRGPCESCWRIREKKRP